MRQGQEALWQLVTGNFLNWKILDAGRIQDGGHSLSKRKRGQCYLGGGFKWHRVVLTWQFLEGSRHMRISRLAVWLWASEQMFLISDDARCEVRAIAIYRIIRGVDENNVFKGPQCVQGTAPKFR